MKTLVILFAVVLCLGNSQAVPGGYTLVSATDVQNNAVIQSLAQYGAGLVVQKVLSDGNLLNSNTNFRAPAINNVYQQVVNGINYRFNVTLTNANNGDIINTIYIVNYNPSTKAQSPVSISYAVAPRPIAPTTTTPTTTTAPTATTPTTTTPTTTTAPTATAPTTTTPTTTTPTTTTTAPTATTPTTTTPTTTAPQQTGGYTQLTAQEIQNNPVIQSLAALGAQNVTQKAIADRKAPANSVFTVTNINSVSAQVVNGINYNFNVNLANADKTINLVAAYIVYYQSWTNTRRVVALSYVVAPY